MSSARRFLLATWEGGGTTPPEFAVLSRLVARGHRALVLGDPCLEADARAAGAEFRPYTRAPHRSTRAKEGEITADWAALTPLGAFARARDRHAFAPAGLFAREVLDALHAWPADAVAVDAMLFGAMAGAEASGLPWAALCPMTSFLPAPGRPPAALGLRTARGPLGALRDRALYALGDALLWRSCTPLLNRARAELGLAPLAHPLEQLRRARRHLVLTSRRFDFDAPEREGTTVYTGPELADPSWAEPLPAQPPWEHGRDTSLPLVLVALSSSYQAQESLLARLLAALAPLPVRVLATLGPALSEARFPVPANAALVRSVSHAAMLPRVALTVTHGGHGTVLRSLAAGVPLVVLPMGRDQADNAARVEWLGAGLAGSARGSAGALRRLLSRALGDASLREGARRFAEELAAPREDLAVRELEGL